MTLRKLKWYLVAYVLFDLLLGYAGVIPLGVAAAAQFTTVTGTVTDPNGIPYANGTIVSVLILPGGTSPTLGGLPYTPPTQPVGLDSTGSFTIQLADNNVLLPAATKWNFTVCSAIGTVQPASGKGPVCFTLASPITITGTSQSITANLNAAALVLTIATAGTTINPTNNVLPKRASAGSFADSSISDNGTTVTVTEPITSTTGGTAFTHTQGTITTSNPTYSHTVTWNAGGVAFTNWLSNITCTAAATASIAMSFGTAGTQWQFKYGAANCASPQLLSPNGSVTNPAYSFSASTNTGTYFDGANSFGFLINGTLAAFVRNNAPIGLGLNGNTISGVGSYLSNTNCAAVGTAANPSVASCSAALAGSFSCATNASTGTCVVNTTAVTANSEIFVTQRADTTTGTRLGVTCNTGVSTVLPVITAVTAATSFTINLGTITTNPECFSYFIVN